MKIGTVLSLDSCFMQGLTGAYFMQSYCKSAGIAEDKIYQYFDIITGSGGNAITALAYAAGITPTQMIDFYIQNGSMIFPGPMSTDDKINIVKAGNAQGREYFYENSNLKIALTGLFTDTLSIHQLKTTVIIPAVQLILTSTNFLTGANNYLFSNSLAPDLQTDDFTVLDVAMAASAIPLYLPFYSVTQPSDPTMTLNFIAADAVNADPTSLGFCFESILNSSTIDRICLLSVGAGLGSIGFAGRTSGSLPVLNNVYYSLMIQGAQASSFKQMKWLAYGGSNLTNIDLYYYKFLPVYDAAQNTENDNAASDVLKYYKTIAAKQVSTDYLKIDFFIQNAQQPFYNN